MEEQFDKKNLKNQTPILQMAYALDEMMYANSEMLMWKRYMQFQTSCLEKFKFLS